MTENWEIDTDCPCFNVPGGLPVNAKLTRVGYGNYPPWNATVTLKISNGTDFEGEERLTIFGLTTKGFIFLQR